MSCSFLLPQKLFLLVFIAWSVTAISSADVEVRTGFSHIDGGFKLGSVPPPSVDDSGAKATFSLVAGSRDNNGGSVGVLNDGRLPVGEDQPAANFFFAAGSKGGRLVVDLGESLPIESVRSYSWHVGSRGPQVYTLFAAEGEADAFDAAPGDETDPEDHGWRRVARIDTRSGEGTGGGQHAVEVARGDSKPLGTYRYLLFVIESAGEPPFGHTFFSEIDVVRADGGELTPVETPETVVKMFNSTDGAYRYTVDATEAPDLSEWAETKMIPVVKEWYPKLVGMLGGDGFTPLDDVVLEFKSGIRVPAYASGNRVTLNSEWFRGELEREALGCVVHELTHVVQRYGLARRTNANSARTPGWIVEGIPDYIRWFLFEPETGGAEITTRNVANARYDGSYRISANFLNWVVENHDRNLIRKLNAAARTGNYSDQLWVDWTGETVESLGAAWKQANQARIHPAG